MLEIKHAVKCFFPNILKSNCSCLCLKYLNISCKKKTKKNIVFFCNLAEKFKARVNMVIVIFGTLAGTNYCKRAYHLLIPGRTWT